VQHKRKLVAAKENIQRGFMIEAVIKIEPDKFIFSGNGAVVLGAVERPIRFSRFVVSAGISINPLV